MTHQLDQPFLPHRKSDTRPGPPALDFDQAVIPSARAYRSLGAQFAGNPLENRVAVIVEPPNQSWVDLVSHSETIQQAAKAFKMPERLFAQVIIQHGCIPQQFLDPGIFAVQDSQRVPLQPV